MKLPPLIRWPGGQSRETRKLARFFPPHDTYVEPFVGGGSFFFFKDPAPTEVIGDTSDWLAAFYDDVRRGGLRACAQGITASPRVFAKALREQTSCAALTISALGFGGFLGKGQMNPTIRLGSKVYRQKLAQLDRYERRLRRAHITRGSFERTMAKFDGPDTWHLLDPPWPDNHSATYYGNDDSEVTPFDVAAVCREMQGTVWVLYNVHPAVLEAFRDFHIHRVKTVKFHGRRGAQPGTKLLITNRPLR